MSKKDLSQLEIRVPDVWKAGIARGWQVIDGSTLTSDLTLEADVVIAGTGAGGGVSAEILSEVGLKVILIEEGRLKTSDDFDGDERSAFRDLFQEGGSRVTKDMGVSIFQGRAVGGTTVVNWTSSFRTPPQTLRHWQHAWGLTGLTEEAMAPWFAQMEKRLKVSKWLLPPNGNNAVLRRGAQAKNWHWDVIPRNVDGCWDIGYCSTGCPTNAKQSMLVTTLPQAMEQGATLVHASRAEKILMEGDRAVGVLCLGMDPVTRMPNGRRVTVKANTVIAAGGGINTPALLLRSNVPDPWQRIGKRTMLHPVTFGLAEFEEEIAPYYGAPQSIYSDEFVWRDGTTGPMGYKLESVVAQPGVAAAFMGRFGQAHQARMQALPHTSFMAAIGRDGFHEQSVGGSISLREDGNPLVDYPLNAYVWEGVRHALHTMMELYFAAGAKKVWAQHQYGKVVTSWKQAKAMLAELEYSTKNMQLGCAHVMGGCAMGAGEKQALVNQDGSYKHLGGLYVIDGSVFPTSIGANPQLSIYGLSARNATALAERLTAA